MIVNIEELLRKAFASGMIDPYAREDSEAEAIEMPPELKERILEAARHYAETGELPESLSAASPQLRSRRSNR